MVGQDVFLVWTAIVCFWTSQPTVLVLSMKAPQDRPVVFPDDDIKSIQEEARTIPLPPGRGNTTVPAAPETAASPAKKIPDQVLLQLSKVQDYAGLLDFLGSNGSGIGDAETNGTVGRKKLSGGKDLSTAAGCQPELQTVELEKPKDETHVYWPMCVRVQRCGGCCTSPLLSCVPVQKTKIDAKVLHAHYMGQDIGGEGFEVMGFKTLLVEKHEKCSCRCKEQPEDCTALQVYKEEECKCVCSNREDMEKCSGVNWAWDPRECKCKCRATEECSTGFFYNGLTCRCEAGKSSLIGKRLPKACIENTAIPAESAEPFSDGDSPSEMPTTAETASTTTTKRPLQSLRGRMARLPQGSGGQSKQPMGVEISDIADSTPFTLQSSKGEEKGASRIPTAQDKNVE